VKSSCIFADGACLHRSPGERRCSLRLRSAVPSNAAEAVDQAATGDGVVLPLPSSQISTLVIGSAAGLLFTVSEGSHGDTVTAYRPEPAGAGPYPLVGVPATAWPDACTLLTPADLRTVDRGYVSASENMALAGVRWGKPVTCAYVGPDRDDPPVTVSAAWVAPSAQQARRLLDSELTALGHQSERVSVIGDSQYLVPDGALPDEPNRADRALIIAGRVIARVTAVGRPDVARRLAPIVAARLHRLYD
jgi:hypothetical protein